MFRNAFLVGAQKVTITVLSKVGHLFERIEIGLTCDFIYLY
jgi:hypothetical protein